MIARTGRFAARTVLWLTIACLSVCTAAPKDAKVAAQAPALHPLAVETVAQLEKGSRYHIQLKSLWEERSRAEGGAWKKTAQGKRVREALDFLRAAAETATTVDPEDPDGPRVVNYTDNSGQVRRFTNIDENVVETDLEVRQFVAGTVIGHSILADATRDGVFLYDVASPEREFFEKGTAAAKQGDYPGALVSLNEALTHAPYAADIHYNMGLAESMIKGRELRAIAWLGAYLAARPDAPNAQAVKEQIATLQARSTVTLRGLGQLAEDVANDFKSGYHHYNSLYRASGVWAGIGDTEALERILSLISDPDHKGYALRLLVDAHLEVHDFAAAERYSELIQDMFTKCKAQAGIAEARVKAGDTDGARQTLAVLQAGVGLVKDAYYRSTLLAKIAEVQIKLGDVAAAKGTLAAAKESIALYDLCYSVVEAQCLIAEAEVRAGDVASAEETFVAARKNADQLRDGTTWGYIAASRARTGDIAAALENLELMRALGQTGDSARLAIIEAQIKNGDVEGAQEILLGVSKYSRESAQALIDGSATLRGTQTQDWLIMLSDKDSRATPMDTQMFLDLAGYLKPFELTGPIDVFDNALNNANDYLRAHKAVGQMVKNLTGAEDASSAPLAAQ